MEKNIKKTRLYEWIESITIALLVITAIFTFCFRLVDVDGTSMLPTLHHGERLVLSRIPYTPTRGDIVVVSQGVEREPLIKRIVAIAGDTVRVDGETGEVFLNGEKLNEPYISAPTATEKMTEAITVPENQVFVMGDNRRQGQSLDSRTFGCVSEKQLAGKVVLRLFPMDRVGGLYDKS